MHSKQKTGFCRSRKGQLRGVTLIEAMVVVSILGILMALAVPSFKSTIESNRRETYVNQLAEDLAFARSEAIKRGMRVVVCPYTTGIQCTGNQTTDWSTGWMVYVDVNSDNSSQVTEPVLRVHEALNLPSGWVAIDNSTAGHYASYRPLGTVQTNFRICMLASTDRNNCNDTNITSVSKYSSVVITDVGRVRIDSKN